MLIYGVFEILKVGLKACGTITLAFKKLTVKALQPVEFESGQKYLCSFQEIPA